MESHVSDIARVIQMAVAPVFLLTAIATLITALNNRLGRIVDRRRVLTERKQGGAEGSPAETRAELALIARRVKLIYFAILAAVLGALSVCLVVASAFIGALVAVDLAKAVAVFFILAMFLLIVCLLVFLREVFLAVTGGKHIFR
ncbi:MAG: DUF2721 domain-containing protein [Betaproteobacteria bacterium]|nr:DUF2721 domain-containing protein [Betaproteobacteria bacterium]